MDRSFLSQPEVVQASRKFVCIRLATYESLSEITVLRSIFVGGSGQVENTTFALLSPDGKTPLTYVGRSPDWAFRQSSQMAATMDKIATYYHREQPLGSAELPTAANLRLALNLGACDNLPVVVAVSDDRRQLGEFQNRLAGLAWKPALLGRAIYSVAQLKTAAGLIPDRAKPGYWVVESGQFGVDGRLLAWIDADSPNLQADLGRALSLYRSVSKDARSHIREGNKRGIHWQTQTPETDPHARP